MRSFIPAYRRSAFLFGSLLLLALSVPAGAEEAEAPEQVWDSIRASVRSGRSDEALERLERYAQSFPRDREACYYLAMLRWRRGDVGGASEAYRRLLALDPQGPFASEARQWLDRQAPSATGAPEVEPAGASPSPAPPRRPSPTPMPVKPLATPTPFPAASASAGVFWPIAASAKPAASLEPARPSPTRTPPSVQSPVPTPAPSGLPTLRPQPVVSSTTPLPSARPSVLPSATPTPSARPSALPTVTPTPSLSPSPLPSVTPAPSVRPSPLPSVTSAPRASATPAPAVASKGASLSPSPRSGPTGKAWLGAQPLGRGGRARSANPPNGFLKAADGTFELRPPAGFRLLDEGERSDEWHLLFGVPAQPGEASPPTLLIVWREVPELLRLRPDQRAARERQLLAEEAASYGSQTSMGVRFGVPSCQVVQQMGAWEANTSLFFRYGRLYALTYGGTGARLGTYRAAVDDALETLRFFQ